MIIQLPQELQDEIIDCLEGDITSLKNASLTCRRWLTRTRYHLFSSVSLDGGCSVCTTTGQKPVDAISAPTPSLRKRSFFVQHGREVAIGNPTFSWAWPESRIISLQESLLYFIHPAPKHLKQLTLFQIDWKGVVHRMAPFLQTYLSPITILHLRSVAFGDINELVILVAALPRVVELRLDAVWWHGGGVVQSMCIGQQPEGLGKHQLQRLKSLSIENIYDVNVIIDMMHWCQIVGLSSLNKLHLDFRMSVVPQATVRNIDRLMQGSRCSLESAKILIGPTRALLEDSLFATLDIRLYSEPSCLVKFLRLNHGPSASLRHLLIQVFLVDFVESNGSDFQESDAVLDLSPLESYLSFSNFSRLSQLTLVCYPGNPNTLSAKVTTLLEGMIRRALPYINERCLLDVQIHRYSPWSTFCVESNDIDTQLNRS
ncbi:hypothetical protein C8Q75DRAFT_581271 [Abortiporus biennis]|nr:hypothetical protein C8Q75DRAFT_581271 [Abortiporus biennis]